MTVTADDWPPEDRAAAEAVVRHHVELETGLRQHTESLLSLTEAGYVPEAEQARRELVAYLRDHLVPHARAEEQTMYPAAAGLPGGALLIEGMLSEHRTIMALADEVATVGAPVRAAAAGRALAALFGNHLAKENDLVLPLIAAARDVSLAGVLAGMHDLLGEAGHDESHPVG